MEFTEEQLNLLSNFYYALEENQKDLELKEKYKIQKQEIDSKIIELENKILFQNTTISSFLKGIILEKENAPILKDKKFLLQGGDDLKYRGISVIKNKNCNSWYARPRINGQQIYISSKNQKTCYEKLKNILNKKNKEEINKTKTVKSLTFLEWYNKWLSLYKKDIRQGTLKNYNTCLNHIKEFFNKKLNEIDAITIQEVLNKIELQRTKQKIYEFLKMIFEKAFLNELIKKNPLNIIDKPKHTKKNGIALTNEDETTIEEMFKTDNKDIFLVILYQGLRKGEALALTIDDIDFDKNTININKSLDYKNNIGTTKNESSKRIMPLFDKTKEILLKYKNTKDRIFKISYGRLEKYFLKYSEKFKEHYTIHSLRHTFITKCQEAGVALHIIQKWVGHTEGSIITNKVYTHTRSAAEQENISIINKLYSTQIQLN